jgi:hypothetical protein
VSVNDDGVMISILVVTCGDDCIDELRVVSMLREGTVDVTEFIVVSMSIDE